MFRRIGIWMVWSGASPIAQNVTLPIIPRLFPRFFIRGGRERAITEDFVERLRIRSTGVNELIEALSGGNQQKVVIAKWLATNPRVLILDEPTRGVDIGAKVEVHRIISELAASGLGIVLISSELPEVSCDERPDHRAPRGPNVGRDPASRGL